MRCPHCQFENREGVHYCEECGEKLIISNPSLCASCGFENREGVKFCEECGAKLAAETAERPKKKSTRKKTQPEPQPKEETVPGLCAACGYQNREGMKFCEECGEGLSGESPAETPKKPAKKKNQQKPEPMVEPSAPPESAAPTQPQTVVVQVQQEQKRPFNPLWVALLLLLLVISCGCLMMYDVVVPPASVAAAVDPMLEAVRVRIPAGIDRAIGGVAEGLGAQPVGDGGKAVGEGDGGQAGGVVEEGQGGVETAASVGECNDLIEQFESGDSETFFACSEDYNDIFGGTISDNLCTAAVADQNNAGSPLQELGEKYGIEIRYEWEDGRQGVSKCQDGVTFWRCTVPRDQDSERIDYTISIGECEFGNHSWEQPIEEPPPPVEPMCCPDHSFVNIYYDAGLLYFDILCEGGRLEEQTARGTVYDGAGNFWTDVECKTVNNDKFSFFACKGLNAVSVKSGNVRLEMEYADAASDGHCEIGPAEGSFPPPAMCPSGQSLCAGICCSEGHCCTCNGKLGCWQSCSGCD